MVFLFHFFCYTYNSMNTFSDPLKIIKQLNISVDAYVADFGCGTGVYSIAIAKKLITGKVFAIDIQKDMVDRLANIAKSENIDKLYVVWGDIDEENGSRLRGESIDFIILSNTLFQVENKKALLKEAFRVMKSSAQILILDWSESFGNIGPRKDHVVGENTAKLLTEETGFIFEKDISVGEHHYGFIARKL